MLTELWTIGDKNSDSFVLLIPNHDGWWRVINGDYRVKRYKRESRLLVETPWGIDKNESHYIGDVKFESDYNVVIDNYRNSKQTLSRNKVRERYILKEMKQDIYKF
jgi:predicted nucleotidyltransferase